MHPDEPLLKSKVAVPTPPEHAQEFQGPCRLNARAAIIERIERLNREVYGLNRLLDALPARMDSEADEALWKMAINNR